ncbi:hypothetical protein WJX74_008385 [Apatococcus lobatus]|uniref:S-adenosyl-L-methionine-dependent methyltransferase n=1 Tax=Apatococcus lobatus TaxID=904363 RepID=A0AAW1RMI1_9CHLO
MRAIEFYSGIGGMHYGLRLAQAEVEIAAAFDIDDVANDVYESNFGLRPHECNIQAIPRSRLEKLAADLWMMAPPCQPYTRRGLKKGHGDARAGSFLSLLAHLQHMRHLPSYLLLENVVGFEVSETHAEMLGLLALCGYVVQEFLLSPVQFGIPYSRPRYFALARRCQVANGPLPFKLQGNPAGQPYCQPPSHLLSNYAASSQLPRAPEAQGESPDCAEHLAEQSAGMMQPPQQQQGLQPCMANLDLARPCDRLTARATSGVSIQPISTFLVESHSGGVHLGDSPSQHSVPADVLDKAGVALDIVTADGLVCNCFTSTYGRYIKGSGSVLATTNLDSLSYHMTPAREAAAANGQQAWRRIAVPSSLAAAKGKVVALELPLEGAEGTDSVKTDQDPAFDRELATPSTAPQHIAALTNANLKPWLSQLGLRFFTPKEIANLHSFPASFNFPSRVKTRKQYALVGDEKHYMSGRQNSLSN